MALKQIKSLFDSEEASKQFRDSWLEWVRTNPNKEDAETIGTGKAGQFTGKFFKKLYGLYYGESDDEEESAIDTVRVESPVLASLTATS